MWYFKLTPNERNIKIHPRWVKNRNISGCNKIFYKTTFVKRKLNKKEMIK